MRATGFFQTRPRTSHHRQATTDRLDDGDAKALVNRRIHKRLSPCIESRQSLVAHTVAHHHPMLQVILTRIRHHLVGIRCLATYNHQLYLLRQMGQGLYRQQYILTRLDRAYTQDIPSGRTQGRVSHLCESGRTTLINQRNLIVVHPTQFDDVALGTLTDGDDMIGLL